ncbi:MAG: hypothetical protein HY777_13190 [Betaproteobacteria bacterium]|nr:hypothetical protein [Betaproteobacteria bacterium]
MSNQPPGVPAPILRIAVYNFCRRFTGPVLAFHIARRTRRLAFLGL